MEPKQELPMGTYKAKCDICFEETDVPNYGDWDCPHCHQPYTYDECHQIRLTDAQWAALRNPSRWIPVTERLPDENTDVLVSVDENSDDCGLHVCVYDDGTFKRSEAGYVWGVTHWMPLPAPPADGK